MTGIGFKFKMNANEATFESMREASRLAPETGISRVALRNHVDGANKVHMLMSCPCVEGARRRPTLGNRGFPEYKCVVCGHAITGSLMSNLTVCADDIAIRLDLLFHSDSWELAVKNVLTEEKWYESINKV